MLLSFASAVTIAAAAATCAGGGVARVRGTLVRGAR